MCQQLSGVASGLAVGAADWPERRAGLGLEACRAAGCGRRDASVLSLPHSPSRRRWGAAGGEVLVQGLVDDVGESAFEAAQRFPAGLSFGAFALVVGPSLRIGADLGDGDCVEHPVQRAVAGPVEPVPAGGASGVGGQRRSAVPEGGP